MDLFVAYVMLVFQSDIHVHNIMYMWRHIVLYGMLDVIKKILPPVECIEESQTIPIFIIHFQEYTN